MFYHNFNSRQPQAQSNHKLLFCLTDDVCNKDHWGFYLTKLYEHNLKVILMDEYPNVILSKSLDLSY